MATTAGSGPSGVQEKWFSQARANPQRIVLADVDDQRVHEAAERLRSDGLAIPVMVDDLASARTRAVEAAAAEIGDKANLDDPLHVGALLVRTGEADGCVAGATRPTADVLRAGIHLLGVAPNAKAISSSFFFVLADGRPVVYGDCGVLPDPDADQLASIAISSAETFRNLAAAWVPAVAEMKAPDSEVAGQANVFIFPDLDAGNIAYKITERIGGAKAFGPLLQGVDGVLHDLSRGASADDIVNVAVIASVQSQNRV